MGKLYKQNIGIISIKLINNNKGNKKKIKKIIKKKYGGKIYGNKRNIIKFYER